MGVHYRQRGIRNQQSNSPGELDEDDDDELQLLREDRVSELELRRVVEVEVLEEEVAVEVVMAAFEYSDVGLVDGKHLR